MLRFRRWARHSYSVFCSIGRKVTIGHLSSDIVDASLRKDRSIHSGYLSGDVRSISYMELSGSDIWTDGTPPGDSEVLLQYLLLSPVTAVSGYRKSDCAEARRFSEVCHSYKSNSNNQLYRDRQLFRRSVLFCRIYPVIWFDLRQLGCI